MSRYRMLVLDIDGTLVNSRDELTPATREAVTRAARAGIRVVLATGRRYSRVLPLVEPLAIDVPLVTASGALVKDPIDHRTFYRAEFEPGVLTAAIAQAARCGFDMVLCGDTYHQGFDFYHAAAQVSTRELAEYLELNPDSGRLWPRLATDLPPEVFLGFTMGQHEQMLDLEAQLHRCLPGRLTTHVLRSPRYRGHLCEIAPAGVTKWSGVQCLAELWGIDAQAICAVGDDVNDLAMIRAAGLGVAMGNALPEVKEAADLIVSTHDDDGLVQVVERILT